ncbi:MAG TPA: type III pantothenate kinase [Candidatus Hydrogenedentes bacterium]|nr:type III pantothenate kinase [Candidatus Hydrogenedentota bacterium]
MLLVMDVGNSDTVAGLYDGEVLRGHWRISTGLYGTSDEWRVALAVLFRQDGLDPAAVSGCCISSVVPQANRHLERACRKAFAVEPLMIGPGVKTGLVIQVENPKEVGADRIVNSVAAFEEYGGPLIVVDFGTATNFDVISESGEYRGGVIVPGVQMSADALFERCAKLPHVEIAKPPTVIGKNTVTHIQAALTYGYADLVDGLIGRMAEEMQASPRVVATGGLADVIAEVARKIDVVDPFLTLKGLRRVFQKNERAS